MAGSFRRRLDRLDRLLAPGPPHPDLVDITRTLAKHGLWPDDGSTPPADFLVTLIAVLGLRDDTSDGGRVSREAGRRRLGEFLAEHARGEI